MPQAVADAFGEGLRALPEGVEACLAAGLHGGADVVALLGAEADVHGLPDEVADHRFDRGDRGLLHRLDEGLDHGLLEFVENAPDDQAGGLGGGQARCRGQAEGDGCGGRGGGDLDGQGDQLGDHGPLGELDEVGAGLQDVRDEERGLGGVAEVAVLAASTVELLVRLDELVDRLTGVVSRHRAGAAVGLGVQLGDLLAELPPHDGAIPELVLVRRRPLVAQHLENPLELVRQHHRHSRSTPVHPLQPHNSRSASSETTQEYSRR
ncbi:hypothetical protein ABZ499_34075 [Streptomyces sp. NPDC019990]|uniref:hypothetical protein n=1 Tax=Streptomyces sp. NPDC019990 TaxID=3154693 RepID=UPI0033C920FE